jgi:hypothetical protein
MRRLLCTRRRVALDVADDYLLAWARLRAAVESDGSRAWIFRRAEHEDTFLEFIEWDDTRADPLMDDGVNAAHVALDAFAAHSGSDEWEEAG